MLWKQAFRTKIWDQDRKAVGRGPTPEAAQEAAERVWVAEGQRRTRPIETLATHFETSRERVTERFLTSDIGSSPFSVFRIARPCSSDGGIEVSVP